MDRQESLLRKGAALRCSATYQALFMIDVLVIGGFNAALCAALCPALMAATCERLYRF